MAHEILASCIGCGACARSCPALAVSGKEKEGAVALTALEKHTKDGNW